MMTQYPRGTGPSLTIHVEGRVDALIVQYIIEAARISGNISIISHSGKKDIGHLVSGLVNSVRERHIALVDSDSPSIFDSREEARRQLGFPKIEVFCAVPTIEAWLFADDSAAIAEARSERARQVLNRLPLPEEIPYPKQLASNVFRYSNHEDNYQFLRNIDVSRASARSPSLRDFLTGVTSELSQNNDFSYEFLSRSIGRDVFSTLLRELPGEDIVWRTLDGTSLSANELAKEVTEGSNLGKQYISEVLRVARDFLSRSAR